MRFFLVDDQGISDTLKGPLGERRLRLARTLSRVLVFAKPKNKDIHKDAFIFGGRSGTRTLGPLIKSQLLYQLS